MPYINVRLTGKPADKEQKMEIIKRITDTMVDVLGKNPETTFVEITEAPLDNFGVGGVPVSQRPAFLAKEGIEL